MSERLTDQVAIIAGGSRGIGRAIAEACAREGAIISMTRGMAVELAPFSIRVNTVCPGQVVTDMMLADVPTHEGRKRLAANTPLGRVGQPEDVAFAAVYLASSESDWCTGQAINVDGGLSILK